MAKPSPFHSKNDSLLALGNAIRLQRKQQGISQESLALAAGLDRSYLGGIERGEHNVALVNLIKISTALNIKLYKLLYSAGI